MKRKTKLSILYILITLIPVIILGSENAARSRKLISPLPQTANADYLTVKYQKPELAPLDEQEKAIYIIKKTWRRDWKTGVKIARCESGLREQVIGITHDVGYFQVNVRVHGWSDEEMQNGIANASYAYILYQEQGLNPWNSSKSCWGELL